VRSVDSDFSNFDSWHFSRKINDSRSCHNVSSGVQLDYCNSLLYVVSDSRSSTLTHVSFLEVGGATFITTVCQWHWLPCPAKSDVVLSRVHTMRPQLNWTELEFVTVCVSFSLTMQNLQVGYKHPFSIFHQQWRMRNGLTQVNGVKPSEWLHAQHHYRFMTVFHYNMSIYKGNYDI